MKQYIAKSLSYADYSELVGKLVKEGRTSGPEQSESRIEFTKLNQYRMRRIEKTTSLGQSLAETLERNSRGMIWLILTEAWCGDAAQAIPAIEAIANGSDLIETRYLLRDENPELMDANLTNGARSIPKLISLDAATLTVLGTWGPRPQAAVDYFNEMKAAGVDAAVIKENLQRWYNEDRTRSIQLEFEGLLNRWNMPQSVSAGR